MVLAAIDIGSNGIRLQIIRVLQHENMVSFKKLEYVRFPLRLGKDVFSEGTIQPKTYAKFKKLMHAYKLLIDLYEVKGYVATATSAMREASNGPDIAGKIAKAYDLDIEIIDGQKEAEILGKAIVPYLDEKTYVHIDVGGGSTELNVYVNKEKICSQSFKIGTVRQLREDDHKKVIRKMKSWIKKEIPRIKHPIIAVGTGGNINKIYKLSHQRFQHYLSFTELQGMRAYISEFDYEQRINSLKMNPDRADVILPAADIFIDVMKSFGADQVMVPRVGLKDGLLYTLYEKMTEEDIKEVQFVEMF